MYTLHCLVHIITLCVVHIRVLSARSRPTDIESTYLFLKWMWNELTLNFTKSYTLRAVPKKFSNILIFINNILIMFFYYTDMDVSS